MKKFWLFLFSLFLGFALFFWVAKNVGWLEIKKALLVFTGWQGLVILLLTVLMALLGSWKWKEIIRGLGAEIPFWSLCRIYLAGFSVRFLAPVVIIGAEIFQGKILKDKNNIPWPKSMASIIIDRIMEWTTNLVVVFFGTLFFLLAIGWPPLTVAILGGAVLLILAILLAFFYLKYFKNESIADEFLKLFGKNLRQPLEIEQELFNFFTFSNKKLWQSLGISFLRALVIYIRTWFLVFFLGKNIGLLPTLSVLGFYHLAMILPIPTALGIHEALQTFAFGSLGLAAATAAAFAMLTRAAELILALAGLIILFRLSMELAVGNFLKNFRKLFIRKDKYLEIKNGDIIKQ